MTYRISVQIDGIHLKTIDLESGHDLLPNVRSKLKDELKNLTIIKTIVVPPNATKIENYYLVNFVSRSELLKKRKLQRVNQFVDNGTECKDIGVQEPNPKLGNSTITPLSDIVLTDTKLGMQFVVNPSRESYDFNTEWNNSVKIAATKFIKKDKLWNKIVVQYPMYLWSTSKQSVSNAYLTVKSRTFRYLKSLTLVVSSLVVKKK